MTIIVSKASGYKLTRFKVGVTIEYYKELCVSALDEQEAKEMVEARIRDRQNALQRLGYYIGDMETETVEELR